MYVVLGGSILTNIPSPGVRVLSGQVKDHTNLLAATTNKIAPFTLYFTIDFCISE